MPKELEDPRQPEHGEDYTMQVECTAEWANDDGVVTKVCDWEGTVDGELYKDYFYWECPECGAEHESGPIDLYDGPED